jgi:hypothetical protein
MLLNGPRAPIRTPLRLVSTPPLFLSPIASSTDVYLDLNCQTAPGSASVLGGHLFFGTFGGGVRFCHMEFQIGLRATSEVDTRR